MKPGGKWRNLEETLGHDTFLLLFISLFLVPVWEYIFGVDEN